MTDAHGRVEAFDPKRHHIGAFSCGHDALDRWLQHYAGQSQRRDAARTFVIAAADGSVAGYYSLVAGEVDHAAATEDVRRGLSRHYPIPVAILARLAVTAADQSHGRGALLLADALRRVARASELVAVRAVVVHAIDDAAAGFYEHHGFRALTAEPRTLMVTLAEIRSAGLGHGQD